MRLRKLLLATSAIVAAGAMAIAPAAMAGPTVGSSTTGDHTINLTMKSASVSIKVYGITTNITCTAGSGSGVAHAGSGLTYWATINSLSLTCPSIFPGTTVTMAATCAIDVDFTCAVTAGVDTAIASTAYFTNHATPPVDCVGVSISNGCTFTVGNVTTTSFDETTVTKAGVNYQALTLSGNGPTIHAVNGCLGAVSNNQTFTLNAVFNVQSPDGLINIQP